MQTTIATGAANFCSYKVQTTADGQWPPLQLQIVGGFELRRGTQPPLHRTLADPHLFATPRVPFR